MTFRHICSHCYISIISCTYRKWVFISLEKFFYKDYFYIVIIVKKILIEGHCVKIWIPDPARTLHRKCYKYVLHKKCKSTESLGLMTGPLGKMVFFNLASMQLCEPDSVKSSHLSDQIHAVTSPNQIFLLTVLWRQQMSYYQMAYTSLVPNGYRWLKYSPQYPRTPCPADAAAVARMQRMHVTCRNTGSLSVGPSGCTNQWHNSMIEVLSLCKHWPHLVSNRLSASFLP